MRKKFAAVLNGVLENNSFFLRLARSDSDGAARGNPERHIIHPPVGETADKQPQSEVWLFGAWKATKKPNKQKGLVWRNGRGDGT